MDPDDLVTLEPDIYWPERYENERDRIESVAGEGLLGVFHVGSTAIERVPGKPVLDVVAVYETREALEGAAASLADVEGYERAPAPTVVVRWAEDHAVFVKLHTRDDEKVRGQLAFREYLRDHPDARREYTGVKREAAEAHPDDHEAYTAAKSDVVASILERAREAGYYGRLPEFA